MNFFKNPYPDIAKQFILQLLPLDIAHKHSTVIERICDSVRHEKDYKQLAMMLIEIYQSGFTYSTNEHKKLLKSYGIDVSIIAPIKNPSTPIFK